MNEIGCRYSREQIILPSMCDGDSVMSIPAALDMFQDTATLHADYFGIGPAGMKERNYFWVISRTAMHVNRMPRMMEHVEARTWIQAADRAKCERDFAVYSGDEILIAFRGIWAVMSHDTGRIVPMAGLYPDNIEFNEPAPEGISFRRFSKDFGGCREIGIYKIRSADIDLGGHMNNVNYIRAMLGCFSSEQIRENRFSDIEVQYVTQSYEGESLRFMLRDAEDGAREIGAVKEDGKTAFLARLR